IFLNVADREPAGTIRPGEYEGFRQRLADHLRSIPGPHGRPLHHRVFTPQDIYQQVRGVAPDLLVYFDDLGWRSVGSFGHPDIYTLENDTGPDDANHAENGIFIYTPPQANLGGRLLPNSELMDFAPTVLRLLDLPIPANMQGRVIEW
ncbi:MAG: hypothetical protein R3300_09920, partial [Candidatus Promineifilaceae bacterium]|nr:hypothetical protein [Candidatus Promineifilaceae bacterium]